MLKKKKSAVYHTLLSDCTGGTSMTLSDCTCSLAIHLQLTAD